MGDTATDIFRMTGRLKARDGSRSNEGKWEQRKDFTDTLQNRVPGTGWVRRLGTDEGEGRFHSDFLLLLPVMT